jgi:hypothetical protein
MSRIVIVTVKILYYKLIPELSVPGKSLNDHHKDRDDPGSYQQESNEIMDMADPEKMSRERGVTSVEILYLSINSDVSFRWFSLLL